ncbi:MAG: carboxypeptidase regulatory-like domain-containing protein [Pyrinomonadaceae bacterium]
MRINILSRIAALVLLCAVCAVVASAQTTAASGKVTIKQADGTLVPVQGAVVTFYRTDIKGKYDTKTDKGGRYVYAGLPFSGTYTIVVSAPNAQPTFRAKVRVSQIPETDFTLDPGNGKVLTLEEINTANATGSSTGNAPANEAELRRRKEALEKQVAAVNAENEKATATNAQLGEILKTGNAAFTSKNYAQAIASFDQGIQADPTQSIFYTNKSIALRLSAADKYNTAIRAKDTAGVTAARADFKTAADLADKAITVYRENKAKNAAGGANAAGRAPNEELTFYLTPRVETYRIAIQANTPNIADAAPKAFQDYLAVETDAAKKAKAQLNLADALFQGNKLDEAVGAYKAILASKPDDLDAMYGLGVALSAAATSVDPPASAKMVEARDALQRFAGKAPSTDPRKQEAESIVQGFDIQLKGNNKPAAPATGKGRRKG